MTAPDVEYPSCEHRSAADEWRRANGAGLCGNGLPVGGQEFVESIDRVAGDAAKDVAEIGVGIEIEALAGGDEAEQNGCRFAAAVAAKERPVAPAHRQAAQAALGAAVIDGQIAVVAVAAQRPANTRDIVSETFPRFRVGV